MLAAEVHSGARENYRANAQSFHAFLVSHGEFAVLDESDRVVLSEFLGRIAMFVAGGMVVAAELDQIRFQERENANHA